MRAVLGPAHGVWAPPGPAHLRCRLACGTRKFLYLQIWIKDRFLRSIDDGRHLDRRSHCKGVFFACPAWAARFWIPLPWAFALACRGRPGGGLRSPGAGGAAPGSGSMRFPGVPSAAGGCAGGRSPGPASRGRAGGGLRFPGVEGRSPGVPLSRRSSFVAPSFLPSRAPS